MILSSGWNERQRLWEKARVIMRLFLIPDMSIDPSGDPNARHLKDAEKDTVSYVVLGQEKDVP